MSLSATLIGTCFTDIRTAMPAANVTVRFGGSTTKTGLTDRQSTRGRNTEWGIDPGQDASVYLLRSELTSVTYSDGTVIECLLADGSTYRKYRVQGSAVVGTAVVKLTLTPEEPA